MSHKLRTLQTIKYYFNNNVTIHNNQDNHFYSLYSTNKTYVEWQASPTITTINTIAYPIKNIEFPAITICSQGAAKDVMDNVLLKQFDEYLKVSGVVAQKGRNQTSTAAGKRKKKIISTIADTLSSGEVLYWYINLVRGAKITIWSTITVVVLYFLWFCSLTNISKNFWTIHTLELEALQL